MMKDGWNYQNLNLQGLQPQQETTNIESGCIGEITLTGIQLTALALNGLNAFPITILLPRLLFNIFIDFLQHPVHLL
jgi:hypothetical protein